MASSTRRILRSSRGNRRAKRDLIVIGAASVILIPVLIWLDLFDWLHEVSRSHEDYEIDEIFVLLLVLGIGFFIFSIRRWIDLRLEIRRRSEAELGLARNERMAAIGTLASGLAHQYNNINSAIMGMSDILLLEKEGQFDEETVETLNDIKDRAYYGSSIARNLSLFTDPNVVSRKPENLPTILEHVVQSLRPVFEQEEIEVEMKMNEVPPVLANAASLSQALYNIMVNAHQALLDQSSKQIVVECLERDDIIVTRITDTGCGISSEDLSQIFTPFYSTKGEFCQEPTAQSTIRGVGLGLSVSDSIIREMGGLLSVESEKGKGTTFTIRIPVYHATA